MIYDEHELIQIAIPKTGTGCIFNMMYSVPLHILDIPEAKVTSFPNAHVEDTGFSFEVPRITEKDPLFDYYKHGHVSYKEYEKMIDIYPQYKKYKHFTLTRNPYDIMVSNYFYAARDVPNIDLINLPFKRFCWGLLSGESGNEWITQVDYLKNREGNIEIDFIGKLENIEEDWNKLRELFPTVPEYDANYRKVTRSKRRYSSNKRVEFADLYDTETKNLVLKYFEEDFDTFNYSKSFPLPSSPWSAMLL
jgi:hypothetical protein